MSDVLVAVGTILLAFYVLSIVSEDYFVPAIDRLAGKLGLSNDAAGATLLAVGSSAPELFTSMFAVLGASAASSDIGAGTIVGSAIFNVLVIVGAAATFRIVKLRWQTVARDMLFYAFTIIMLIFAFQDGSISLFEALSFVGMYVVYVAVVINWRKFVRYTDPDPEEIIEEAQEYGWLGTNVRKVFDVLLAAPRKKPTIWVPFIGSIAIIALLSHQLVHGAVVIGEHFDISPTFLALTVLAAGTSVPDLIGSVVVAKQGRGDMAVSNAVGSNIFDILFGLGVPWVIAIGFLGRDIEVSTDNLNASAFLLLATVVSLVMLLALRKWHLNRTSGYALIALYVGYLIYVITQVL